MGIFKSKLTDDDRKGLQELDAACGSFIANHSRSSNPDVQQAVQGVREMQGRSQKKLRKGRH
ncbi:hypothetical protein ABGB18_42520 [Nonomuraea sp. B12E4]|uniref:hypothetical protein n=1 Tax=Nonomuraea sp. B12E4 TaxID=3153564 RepID=UPI00325E3F2E